MQQRREQGSDYLVKLRTLTKAVPRATFTQVGDEIEEVEGTSGWEVITHSFRSSFTVGGWEGYIDLSGYQREDQTWFTRNAMIQGMAQPGFSSAVATRMYVYEIVSDIRLSHDTLALCASGGQDFPGCLPSEAPGGEVDLQNIVFGRVREFAPLTNLPVTSGAVQILSENFFGTNAGTASNRLWCYVVIGNIDVTVFTGQVFFQGPVAFVISGAVDTEPDLEYIMRLKRSYELGDTFS